MDDYKISVVIPVKDRVDVIQRAIDSVLAQTISVSEIIIVDDGSTDGTLEKVEKLSQDNRQIKLFKNNENKGAPFTRNKGATFSSGTHIAFLDSDDKWLPQKLEKQLNVLKQQNGLAAFSNFKFVRGNKISVGKVKPVVTLEDLFGRNILGGTSSVLVSKKAFEQVGGFTTGLASCQDWDLWLKLAELGNLYCIDEALVEYHIDGNDRISTNSQKALTGHEYIFTKIDGLMKECHYQNVKTVKARQSLRMAEIYIKNLGDKRNGIKQIFKSLLTFPNRDVLWGNLKLMYFLIR